MPIDWDSPASVNEIFFGLADEVLDQVRELSANRSKGYNSDTVILEYFPDGVRDLLYEVNKKRLRVRNLYNQAMDPDSPSRFGEAGVDDPIEDSLLDMVNYVRYAYAFMRMCVLYPEEMATKMIEIKEEQDEVDDEDSTRSRANALSVDFFESVCRKSAN